MRPTAPQLQNQSKRSCSSRVELAPPQVPHEVTGLHGVFHETAQKSASKAKPHCRGHSRDAPPERAPPITERGPGPASLLGPQGELVGVSH